MWIIICMSYYRVCMFNLVIQEGGEQVITAYNYQDIYESSNDVKFAALEKKQNYVAMTKLNLPFQDNIEINYIYKSHSYIWPNVLAH